MDADRGSLRPWLFAVARRIAVDAHRRRAARPREVGDEALASVPAHGDDIDRALDVWLVADALATLTPAHREVLVQTYFSGKTVAEAAGALGIPVGTVKSPDALRAAGAAAGPARARGDVMSSSSCPHTLDVAPYALGTLDEPDRAELEEHLHTCADCRTLLAEVAGLPRLLALVPVQDAVGAAPPAPSEAMFERLLASAVAQRRTSRTRRIRLGSSPRPRPSWPPRPAERRSCRPARVPTSGSWRPPPATSMPGWNCAPPTAARA